MSLYLILYLNTGQVLQENELPAEDAFRRMVYAVAVFAVGFGPMAIMIVCYALNAHIFPTPVKIFIYLPVSCACAFVASADLTSFAVTFIPAISSIVFWLRKSWYVNSDAQ